VQVSAVETDFSPKPAKDTGEPLDFAIVGEGFFAVQTANGTRYTRNGQFTADAQGRLVTSRATPSSAAAAARCRRRGRPRRPAQPRGRHPAQPAQGRRQRSSPAPLPAPPRARSRPAALEASAPTPPARWST
jgi:flagellar basal-body rod protein FlgG